MSSEARKESHLAWLYARERAWIEDNGPCAWCGSDQELLVDLVDPLTPNRVIFKNWSLALDNPKRIEFLARCQVLCRSCKSIKKVVDRKARFDATPCGLARKYRRGCRCEQCRTVASVARKALRKRKS